MYARILLCYDASAEGRNALREGADIARAMRAEAHLLAICRSLVSHAVPEGVTEALVHCEEDAARATLEEGVRRLRECGLVVHGHLAFGDPIERIPEMARRIGADLVVVGHHRRGRLARWWSDSDEERLLDRVPCSILAAIPR